MRALCDVCEAAAAKIFCAADEAALCLACDEKVHSCNKLAVRHVRLELAEARAVPRCDICESAPAFFFCGVDGTSLCLLCDMEVHTGGKKLHERYLLMGQRVELPKNRLRGEGANGRPGQHHHLSDKGVGQQDEAQPMAALQQVPTSPEQPLASSGTAMATATGDDPVTEERTIDLNSRPAQHRSQRVLSGSGAPSYSSDGCVALVAHLEGQKMQGVEEKRPGAQDASMDDQT